VTKPIEPDVLYQALARWFRRAPAVAAAPAAAKHTGAVDALPQIEGVDVAGGLKRVAGNRALYRSLLAKFADGQAGAPEAIRRSFAAGDHGTAERLAHTLKGVAGNIGAGSVQASAADLEHAIRKNVFSERLVERVEGDLSVIIRHIKAALPGMASGRAQEPAAPPADPGKVKDVMGRLMTLVAESDGGALDCLNDNAQILQSALPGTEFSAIEKALNDFEFDAALERIKVAAASLQ
jgi:two-component system sensor histidine kinase/response regulator